MQLDINTYPAVQPLQTVENEKWDDENYWRQNVRWVCSMYNQLVVTPQLVGLPNQDPFYGLQNRYVPQYVKYARYVFGWQYGTSYELTAKDGNNNNTQIPLYRGKDIIALFNYFRGKFGYLIKPIPDIMQAGCIAGDALSRKTTEKNVMKYMMDGRNFLKQQQLLGNIQVEAGTDLDITDEQDIEALYTNFVEASEKTYVKFGKSFYISNECYDQFIKGAQYCFIGGRATSFITERNGKVYMDLVPPEYAVVDMNKNDDQHRDDDYAGQIKPYSVSDVVSKWKLTQEEAEDLERIARDGTSQAPYVTGWVNFNWYSNYNGVPKVWVAEKVQWQSITYVDKVPVSCIREATLIGNKYLKDQKIVPNSILDKRDKRRKRLSYITCTPNTILGANQGVIGMVSDMQDIKDSLITMMLNSVARSIGKAIYIDTAQLPEGMRSPEFLSQLKQNGVIAANRSEIDADQKMNPLIEVMDLTLDPNINSLLNQVAYFDNAIADVLNMPKNVRLGSGSYQSEGQRTSNAENSDTGNQWLYGSLTKWIENNIEFAADLWIKIAAEGGEDIAVMVGDTMAEMLTNKEIQDCYDSDYKMYLNFDNTVTQEAKVTLQGMAVQEAGVNPDAKLEFLNILELKTISGMKSYLQNEKRKRQQREDAAIRQQQEAAAANSQMQAEAQQNIAAQQANASLENSAMNNNAKQEEMMLQNEMNNAQPPQQ